MLRALRAAPLPVTLLIFCFLCPTEFSLFVGGLRLPPHRVVLIILFGFALMRLFSRGDVRLRGFDLAFVAFNVWTVFAYSRHDPSGSGMIYGGSLALESLGAYLIARVYVRDVADLTATLKVMLFAIAVAALIALPETLFGQHFVHDALRSITGYHHPTGVETRLGFTRAYGTFDHPIHLGTFCAGLLALFWFSHRRPSGRRGRAALASGAAVLGLSSAPLLCLGLQGGMIVWERLTRSIPSRTAVTVAALVGLYLGAELMSSRSVPSLIATRLTLDSWTGFYRIQIWEHGLANVWAHPWFGIGLAEWTRPWWMVSSTVDAFWLVVAMRTGVPAFLLLATAILLLAHGAVSRRRAFHDPMRRRLVLGWMMSLIALCLIGATVHFWNVLYAFFFFFLGLGGVLADPKAPRRKRAYRGARAPRAVPRARVNVSQGYGGRGAPGYVGGYS